MAKNNLDTSNPNFLKQKYLPSYNNSEVNNFQSVQLSEAASKKEIIDEIDKTVGNVNTSTRKLLDISLTYLTCNNINAETDKDINPIVKIPLLDYAEATGLDLSAQKMNTPEEQQIENDRAKTRKAKFKRRTDLNLSKLLCLNYRYTSRDRKTFMMGYFITDAGVEHYDKTDYIVVKFNDSVARYLISSKIFQFPIVLLLHDGRNPNAYAIGRAIAIHASIYNNIRRGTANTLSVQSLLSEAPEIISIQTLEEQKQRTWRDRIKKPLEGALNDNIKIGFLTEWHYRNKNTGELITTEETSDLSYTEYSNLYIDYILTENSYQEQQIKKLVANDARIDYIPRAETQNYNFEQELPF